MDLFSQIKLENKLIEGDFKVKKTLNNLLLLRF